MLPSKLPVRPSLSRQLELFKRSPSFGLLFLASFGSGLGTWLAFVALTVDVFDRTHSGPWVSALLIADFLPTIAIGLLFGPLLDRLSRRGLMVAADLARFGVFCALPFATSATQIVALAAAAGFATGFFRPAVYAGLPNLVADADLPRANSLLQTIENVTTTAGPLAGGILVGVSSPDTAYWLNAVTFVVSALLILGSRDACSRCAPRRAAGTCATSPPASTSSAARGRSSPCSWRGTSRCWPTPA